MSQFDWPITKKKVETMEAPQNRRFYGKMAILEQFKLHNLKKRRESYALMK
jgi:hypothetical protein